MRTRTLHAAGSVLATVAAGALLTGCSGTPTLDSGTLADTVAQKLAEATGRPEPDVTCPEDLAGEVGTKTRCTLTAADGSTIGVTVTVTSVEGTQINFDIKADDKPTS
ncbi:DUF4333 domain-containing protein [Streptomyces sp. DSM 42041]|uniref:DUF4333 domain-containing protein n=1 Tax=Streptomyces hazeniae TaxID=3075538 RepID=A0ABU2NTV2_9ACTN|nr:DUF4333 domain-containing protein [Streptomyces sp. DSM 42041]MDT0380400.1 DUF4333 domain-containing protein [Streptomyces sp. DSM 42041]